nr:PREDICTED: 2-hydroxyacylsphingosine 1-beta-galactosyltransferase-like [Bemisia tabaci]
MNSVKYFICGFSLLATVNLVTPARILFLFPHEFTSHYKVFSPVVEQLAMRGHEVTAYVAPVFKRKQPLPNYREIVVHRPQNSSSIQDFDFVAARKRTGFGYTWRLWSEFSTVTEGTLQSSAFQELIRSREYFELIIMEATMQQESFLAFGHKFGAPVINLHPLFMSPLFASLTGNPNPLSYVPDFRLPYTVKLSFWQRVHNTMMAIFDLLGGHLYLLPRHEGLMRKYFNYPGSEALPSVKDLITNISLHLVDSHPMMYVRPYAPNIVEVAGMDTKPTTQLPQDLKKFMDEAPEGVIYFSLGSHLDPTLFPDHVRRMFIETLKNVKQRVVLKWPVKVEGDPKNIFQHSWLPQDAILAHPNCKLFITHGGFNSLVEVMSAGVPVLGLPMFADQFHNVAYYEHVGVGQGASIDDLTFEKFTEIINKIVYTPSYAENSKRLAKIYGDLPATSLERAVYWVEYVIRHKGAHHLKPASVTLPFYKYILLDVIAFCLAVLVSAVYILKMIVRKVLFTARSSIKSELKKTKSNKKHD